MIAQNINEQDVKEYRRMRWQKIKQNGWQEMEWNSSYCGSTEMSYVIQYLHNVIFIYNQYSEK